MSSGALDSFRMGIDRLRTSHAIRRLEFSAPSSTSGEEKRAEKWVKSLMANDLTNQAYIMTPYIKTLDSEVRELPVCWTHSHAGSMVHSDSTGTEAPAVETFVDLILCTSSSSCSFVPFIINCDHKFLSSVCHPSKLSNLGDSCGTPKFGSQPGRSVGHHLQLASEVGSFMEQSS